MQDTSPAPTTLKPGRYAIHNGATHTSQVWNVTAERVDIYTAPSGVYPSVLLDTVSHVDALEVLGRVTSRILAFVPAPMPTIGKARAHKLHRLLGRVPCDHYGIASRALGRKVESLAALTEQEARKVWKFVVWMFPDFFPKAA